MYDSEAKSSSKILIVEDDTDIRQVLCVFLKYSGFEVQGVSNGQEAINIIPEFCPDLIVLDLKMRPLSGWDVLHWLRVHRLTPPLPVLVLTALTHLSQQVRGFEEGAVEYMTKPTQPSMLVAHIRTLLSMTDEQRVLLQRQRFDEHRKRLERLSAPQSDEFVY
ncbi:MAG: response regulator [Ktedonobacteraceae bacterium]|nr:response regulator [Ktedonobacteraceae bacterium]